MAEQKVYYGLKKEDLDTLYEYFMNRTAKEALPYLKLLGGAVQIQFTESEVTEAKDPAQLPLPLVEENEPGGEDVPETVISPV